MKRNYFILIIFLAILAAAAGFKFLNKSGGNQKTQIQALPESAALFSELEPRINNEGSAAISVTPRGSADTDVWKFGITLSTHSVELNENLTKTTVLIAGNKEYQPAAWEGDPPGGHHREGALMFNSITPTPAYIELKIKDVGGVPERLFKWNL